jgi:hypothetical protein
MQTLGKVRHINKVISAQDDYVCEFSGTTINVGDSYWRITYTPADLIDGELDYVTEGHQTVKICSTAFEEFVKSCLYIDLDGKEKEEFERDITEVEKVLHKFWDKYKDVPGIQDTLDKNRSRITLP